jgi:hypothetical protein
MTAHAQTAQDIVDVLVNHFILKPGDPLRADVFLRVWQSRGNDPDEFAPGLEHAITEGWVERIDADSFRLTQEGFDIG